MSLTNNWYMLKPSDFKKIQDYIDYLTCVAHGGCQNKNSKLSPQDINMQDAGMAANQLSYSLSKIKESLQSQRSGQ